eukprot:COSAG01_NODE_11305_length_1962_cov_1.892110_1_plen_636_part_01
MSIRNHFDPQELQRRMRSAEFANRFPLILDMYQDRLTVPGGKQPDSDQRQNFIYWMGSALKNVSGTLPFEQLHQAELMDGERSGKRINFENIDTPAYDLYRNLSSYKEKLDKDFKAAIAAGQSHQDAVKALYKRHGLPDELKQALLPHITRFGTPHDIALYGDIKDKNFALPDERLHDYLNKPKFQDYYFSQDLSPLHLVGEERYQAIHQSLADISDRYIDHITVPDIYLDNNSKTIDIHENMHDLILDRSFQTWQAKDFYSYLHVHRSRFKTFEKGTRQLFGPRNSAFQLEQAGDIIQNTEFAAIDGINVNTSKKITRHLQHVNILSSSGHIHPNVSIHSSSINLQLPQDIAPFQGQILDILRHSYKNQFAVIPGINAAQSEEITRALNNKKILTSKGTLFDNVNLANNNIDLGLPETYAPFKQEILAILRPPVQTEASFTLNVQQTHDYAIALQRNLTSLQNNLPKLEIAVQRIHQLDDSYNYLSQQQQPSSQTVAILADCLDRLLSLKKRFRTDDFSSQKRTAQLPQNPLSHLQSFFDGVDWDIVSPLDFQPMQMVLLNQDWIRYQFFDASINTQTDQAALMDFREQGILKTLMHIDKESIAKHRPSYQINTHDLHKNADDIELGAQIFRRLQ